MCACLPAEAGVYKWTDAQGKVHFSDVPPPTVETEKVNVVRPSGVKPTVAPPAASNNERRRTEDSSESEERERKKICASLRADQKQLEAAPSGLAIQGEQREVQAKAMEQNDFALKHYKCGS